MTIEVLTAGYQGESIENFIQRLRSAEVESLVDVRRIALSRKRGFSKSSLRSALADAGISYAHMPELGMPRELLAERPFLEDNTPILDAYEELLPTRDAEVKALFANVSRYRTCLLCFEADDSQCHRSRLGTYLEAKYPNIKIVHLRL